jgi:hypothetical protein
MSRRVRSQLAASLLVVTASLAICVVGVSGAAESAHASSVPPFCSRLSLTKIGSIVGGSVTLLETSLKGKTTACIFHGSVGSVSIETTTALPSSATSTLSAAEKTAQANFPAGLKVKFAGVSSIGPTAYSWSAKIYGTPYVGLNTNKGSVGYYIEMQGAPTLSVLESLLKYEIATK